MKGAPAIRVALPGLYRIECAESDLAALESSCIGAREILRERLRTAEQSLAFWQRQKQDFAQELRVASENVTYFREQLAKAERAVLTLLTARPVRLCS